MKKLLAGAIAVTSLGLSLSALAQDTGTGSAASSASSTMMDADDSVTTSAASSTSSGATVPSQLPDTGAGGLAE